MYKYEQQLWARRLRLGVMLCLEYLKCGINASVKVSFIAARTSNQVMHGRVP